MTGINIKVAMFAIGCTVGISIFLVGKGIEACVNKAKPYAMELLEGIGSEISDLSISSAAYLNRFKESISKKDKEIIFFVANIFALNAIGSLSVAFGSVYAIQKLTSYK